MEQFRSNSGGSIIQVSSSPQGVKSTILGSKNQIIGYVEKAMKGDWMVRKVLMALTNEESNEKKAFYTACGNTGPCFFYLSTLKKNINY